MLMVLSQLLLTVFVARWILSEYNSEKESLKRNLSREFSDSKQQVMDSLIVMHFIDPLLKDKKGFKVHLEIADDSLPQKILRKAPADSAFAGRHFFHETDTVIEEHDSTLVYDDLHELPRKNFLTHSVKLFIKKAATPEEMDSLETTFLVNADTALFQKTVEENFNKEGSSFRLSWFTDHPEDPGGKENKELYFESDLLPKKYGVEVGNYAVLLLKKISPQILFAIALLGLTGAAFLFAFRSLRKETQMNILKNDFISNISHELKTPVSTVKVAIEALQDADVKKTPAKTSEYLEIAALELNRLELLINSVLNVSALEGGMALLQFEPTDLKVLIQEVLKTMQQRIDNAHARVQFDAEGEIRPVNADRLHVRGVLVNLIDNSLKYAGANPEIRIVLDQQDERTIVTVSDNGPGIPAEYLAKVYDRFFRVPASSHHVKGHGLGLSYVAMVMKKHGGHVTAANQKEGGSVFTLAFPREI